MPLRSETWTLDVGFAGCLAGDKLGAGLMKLLTEGGINTSGLKIMPEANTRIAEITNLESGDRQVKFTTDNVADEQFAEEDLPRHLFDQAHVLHIGSISLIKEPIRSATVAAVQLARDSGMIVSFDPNIRFAVWPDQWTARRRILDMLENVHVVKVSGEELRFLANDREADLLELAVQFRRVHELALLLITQDVHGARYVSPGEFGHVRGFKIDAVDPTGAGDAFTAAISAWLIERFTLGRNAGKTRHQILSSFTRDELIDLVRFANAVAALACTKIGAIEAMPNLSEVEALLDSQG